VPSGRNRTRLAVAREEARKQISERMKKAGDINADEVQLEADLADAIEKEKRWREYNSQLLSHLFTTDEYAQAGRGRSRRSARP
jgi:Tfp pilus assembly protein PilF